MTFLNILFVLSTILTLGCACLIALTKNIIHSCIYLLGTLIGVAGLYVTLSADFIAAVQVLVYVGGVVILILFAVMLTGGQEFLRLARSGMHQVPPMGNRKSFFVGALSAVVLGLTVAGIVFSAIGKGIPVKDLKFESTVDQLGSLLITDHVLAFEMISILLLGALVGAAVIARPVKTRHEEKEDSKIEGHGHGH